jgi:N-acetylmuramoyl-L-alanine amidase
MVDTLIRGLIGPVLLLLVMIMPSLSADLPPVNVQTIQGGDYVYLDELAGLYNLESSFDIITQKGKLYYKNHYAVYTVSYSLLVIDGRLFRSGLDVVRHGGAIVIPRDAARAILENFFTGCAFRDDGAQIICSRTAPPTPRPERPPPARDSVKDRISFVVIDAGHGGKDPGAVGKGGLLEKNITLAVARYVERELAAKFPGMAIVMTRKNDRFIELSRRTDMGNELLSKYSNGLFLSIHVNASLSPVISGFETYFLSQNPSNEEARSTAALENNVIVLEEKGRGKLYNDVDYIEAMMLTTQIQKESMLLAESIQGGLEKKVRDFKSRGTKSADFFVLRGVLMPAALVEIGFITNAREARALTTQAVQQRISSGIVQGIADFITKYNALIKCPD